MLTKRKKTNSKSKQRTLNIVLKERKGWPSILNLFGKAGITFCKRSTTSVYKNKQNINIVCSDKNNKKESTNCTWWHRLKMAKFGKII